MIPESTDIAGCYILLSNNCVTARIITAINALKDFSYYDSRLNVIGFQPLC
ncbi:Uncharacterised protein [Yersinia intermedia]|nr:Uncharacterised protein [Yersinia intermedia]